VWKVAAARLAAPFLAVAVSAGCSSPEPARLTASVEGPAVAAPQFFHGNCFAGWSVRVELRVRETEGTAVWLDGLDFRILDAGLGGAVTDQSLDSVTFTDNYGERLVPPHGSVLLPVGGPSGERPVGPIVLEGVVRGRDENGNAVAASFHLTASSLDVHDPEPPGAGACSSPGMSLLPDPPLLRRRLLLDGGSQAFRARSARRVTSSQLTFLRKAST